MAYKQRTEPEELIILRVLNIRMVLPDEARRHYFSLKKGFEGESIFDELTEKLTCECYILNDLLFKVNGTTFQIDTLIITSGIIYVFELKNYEGDYYYDCKCNSDSESDSPPPERLYKLPKAEYNNPLYQLNRSESLLRQLLRGLGVKYPIEAKVVFINPKFTLYLAPLDRPFILPAQITTYLEKLDTTPSKLNGSHKKLADKLLSLHIKKSPYTQLPPYTYEQQRKGMTCEVCQSFKISVHGRKCVCGDCGHEEEVESAVLRTVREIKLLFPDWKITTSGVMEWCMVIDRKRISRILRKHYKIVGERRWIYYE